MDKSLNLEIHVTSQQLQWVVILNFYKIQNMPIFVFDKRLVKLTAIGLESCPYEKSIKIYLKVPFIKKDEIKKLGGSWDKDKKKWFVYNNKNIEKILTLFSKE